MKKLIALIFLLTLICPVVSHAQDRSQILAEARYLKSVYKTDAAISLLSELLRADEFDSELLGEMAECHIQSGDYDSAVSTYSMLSAKEPDNLLYKIKLMSLTYRLKEYGRCASLGRAVLQLDTIPAMISLTGDAFNQMGQLDSALVYYDHCLKLNPVNASVLSKAAKIHLDRKKYNTVLDMTYDFLQLDTANMDVRAIRGLAFYMKSDYKASEEVFQKMEDDGNDSYNVHFYLGQSQWHNNKPFYARKELERAWQIDSSDYNLAFSIASVILDGGQTIEKAGPWLDKALEILTPDPVDVARIYRRYGSGYIFSSDFPSAVNYYKKAFEQDPRSFAALYYIGYSYERMKDWKHAKEYYERYLKLAKPGTDSYDSAKAGLDYVKQQLFMEEK